MHKKKFFCAFCGSSCIILHSLCDVVQSFCLPLINPGRTSLKPGGKLAQKLPKNPSMTFVSAPGD